MIDVRRLCKSALVAVCIVSLALIVIVAVSRITMTIAYLIYSPVLVPLVQYISGDRRVSPSHEYIVHTISTYSVYYRVLGYPIMPYVSVLVTVFIANIIMLSAIPFLCFPALGKMLISLMYSNSESIILCSIIVALIYVTSTVYRMKEKQP